MVFSLNNLQLSVREIVVQKSKMVPVCLMIQNENNVRNSNIAYHANI